MKINLKVRFKNPTFWMTFIPALATFIYTTLGLFNIVPKVSEDEVVNVITVIITFLANLGVLNDPTIKGMSDSSRAMDYQEPQENANH